MGRMDVMWCGDGGAERRVSGERKSKMKEIHKKSSRLFEDDETRITRWHFIAHSKPKPTTNMNCKESLDLNQNIVVGRRRHHLFDYNKKYWHEKNKFFVVVQESEHNHSHWVNLFLPLRKIAICCCCCCYFTFLHSHRLSPPSFSHFPKSYTNYDWSPRSSTAWPPPHSTWMDCDVVWSLLSLHRRLHLSFTAAAASHHHNQRLQTMIIFVV